MLLVDPSVTVLLWAIESLTLLGLISVLAAAVPLSPASTYVHTTVHCINLFCISYCTACYLVFTNKME